MCDGYVDGLFHFNFGWNGLGNGYYSLEDAFGFSSNQKCITDIYPTDPAYPTLANGADTICSLSGSLTDDSGPAANYTNNMTASWLIQPQTAQDSVSYITISFVEFETATSDWLTIYDGPTAESPVLVALSGSEVPEQVSSSDHQLLVTFVTDDTVPGKGWQLEFDAVYPDYCNTTTVLTDPMGEISDGSGPFNYTGFTNCLWKIEPAWADQIKLSFTAFETEEGIDVVKIFDGNTQVAAFSGNTLPDPVYASSGTMTVIFFTNGYNHFGGWEANYTLTNVGMLCGTGDSELQIFPNPAHDQFILTLQNHDRLPCCIELISVSGHCVHSEDLHSDMPFIRRIFQTDRFPGGMYFLKVSTGNGVMIRKIMIL